MKIHLRAIAAAFVILAACVLAHVMIPREILARASDVFDLEKIVPRQFGEWKPARGIQPIVSPENTPPEIYDQEFGRGYTDRAGHVVMLYVGYGADQSFRLKLHRPDICYVAGGFRLSSISYANLSYRDGARPLTLKRLVAQRGPRFEPLSYWMRIGDTVTTSNLEREFISLRLGLHGFIPDGMLIRVSTLGLQPTEAYAVQDRFIRDLLAAVGPANLRYFVGYTLNH